MQHCSSLQADSNVTSRFRLAEYRPFLLEDDDSLRMRGGCLASLEQQQRDGKVIDTYRDPESGIVFPNGTIEATVREACRGCGSDSVYVCVLWVCRHVDVVGGRAGPSSGHHGRGRIQVLRHQHLPRKTPHKADTHTSHTAVPSPLPLVYVMCLV